MTLLLNALAAPPETHASVHMLPNGLTVILEEDHRSDEISLMIAYGIGSRDERPGEHGCAHLFEHLMFEGSAHVGNNQFDDWLTQAGGNNNAWTSEDDTVYHMVFPSGALDLALFLESDRMAFLEAGLDQANLSNQIEVVLQERLQGYADPHGRDYDALTTRLYPEGHPYHVPVIGTVSDVRGFQLAAVVDFWRRHYRPKNAILTLVGHFDSPQALSRVEHWFSDVPDAGPREPRADVWNDAHGTGIGVVHDRVEDRTITVAWPTVPSHHPDAPALELLSWVLNGGPGTRLDDAMYYQRRLATSVSAWASTGEVDGMFVVDASAARGSLPRLVKAMDKVFADLETHPPTEAELERARRGTLSSLEDALDDLTSRAWLLTSCHRQWADVNCVRAEYERYAAVSTEDLLRVQRTWLRPEARVLLATVPEGDKGYPGAVPVELP